MRRRTTRPVLPVPDPAVDACECGVDVHHATHRNDRDDDVEGQGLLQDIQVELRDHLFSFHGHHGRRGLRQIRSRYLKIRNFFGHGPHLRGNQSVRRGRVDGVEV